MTSTFLFITRFLEKQLCSFLLMTVRVQFWWSFLWNTGTERGLWSLARFCNYLQSSRFTLISIWRDLFTERQTFLCHPLAQVREFTTVMGWKITLQSSLGTHRDHHNTHCTCAHHKHTPHIHTKYTTYSHPYGMDRRAINGLNFIFSAGRIQRLTGQERRVALVSRELPTLSPERVCICTVSSVSQSGLFCDLSPYCWINWSLAQPLHNWTRVNFIQYLFCLWFLFLEISHLEDDKWHVFKQQCFKKKERKKSKTICNCVFVYTILGTYPSSS